MMFFGLFLHIHMCTYASYNYEICNLIIIYEKIWYICLMMNGNSLIINKTGHIDLFDDWYTWIPSVFKVNETLVSLHSGSFSEQSTWYIFPSYMSLMLFLSTFRHCCDD